MDRITAPVSKSVSTASQSYIVDTEIVCILGVACGRPSATDPVELVLDYLDGRGLQGTRRMLVVDLQAAIPQVASSLLLTC